MSNEKPDTNEPSAREPMSVRVKNKARSAVTKVTTRDGWIGDYNFGWLCTPTLPYGGSRSRKLPPFYGLEDDIPLLLAIVCGFQHSLGECTRPYIRAVTDTPLAMIAGTESYLSPEFGQLFN